MTPKRIAELKKIFSGDDGREALEWIGGEEVRDLLDTADRAAGLAEALDWLGTQRVDVCFRSSSIYLYDKRSLCQSMEWCRDGDIQRAIVAAVQSLRTSMESTD